jgi:acyl-CoA dehydrogenase
MSDIRSLISESVNKMFAEGIDAKRLEAAEEGEWPADLWTLVEESGFTRVLLPEEAGGTGGGWVDAHPVLHAAGYHRAPLPLAETVVGNWLLSQAGLPVDGGACTVLQLRTGDSLRLELDGGLMLSGQTASVPWARMAERLVVAGSADGKPVIGLLMLDAPGVRITPETNAAREPRDRVAFDRCRCLAFTQPAAGALSDEPVLHYGALARSVAMVGALESVLAQTVQYAGERVQFGRPIGKFQAIQQSIAVMASEVTAAGTAVEAACEAANRGPARFEIAVAKIRAGTAAGVSAAIAHQVHGAIGFCYEHTLQFGTRRLWSWRAEFGNESSWAQRLGAQAIRSGGDRFWEDLLLATGSAVPAAP